MTCGAHPNSNCYTAYETFEQWNPDPSVAVSRVLPSILWNVTKDALESGGDAVRPH